MNPAISWRRGWLLFSIHVHQDGFEKTGFQVWLETYRAKGQDRLRLLIAVEFQSDCVEAIDAEKRCAERFGARVRDQDELRIYDFVGQSKETALRAAQFIDQTPVYMRQQGYGARCYELFEMMAEAGRAALPPKRKAKGGAS